MSKKQNVIAVDGPAGSGKSSVARKIAQGLDLLYIDTGAMFRAMAYFLSSKGINVKEDNLDENKDLNALLAAVQFQYLPKDHILIEIDGEDLTEKIREHHISELASLVSQYAVIRDFLANIQRSIALERESVLEGRDIGTVIFPQAKLKIFLTATPEERAKRRTEELRKKGVENIDESQILEDIKLRDKRDETREIAPLKKADDALEIDTTGMTIGQVVDKIIEEYKNL